jgi:hypothetical protein
MAGPKSAVIEFALKTTMAAVNRLRWPEAAVQYNGRSSAPFPHLNRNRAEYRLLTVYRLPASCFPPAAWIDLSQSYFRRAIIPASCPGGSAK